MTPPPRLQPLGQGRAADTRGAAAAMERDVSGSDADGAWFWKDVYDALEAAQAMFLRKFGAADARGAGSPGAMPAMLTRSERVPSHTRRSEESERLQYSRCRSCSASPPPKRAP